LNGAFILANIEWNNKTMEPRIELLKERKLVGLSSKMSLADNTTPLLWKGLMTRRREITNNVNEDLISMQVYDQSLDFSKFTPQTIFDKWATVEVANFDHVPKDMQTFVLPEGHYAVFIHRGLPSDFPKTARYIFGEWLPKSNYLLDNRPHFEVLGAKYKDNDPSSEEEVWVPIMG
jgi:AraC family transcriptional regulator